MKFLMVTYILVWILVMFLAIIHRDDVDENEEFKINNYLLLWLIMAFFIPAIAKISGLI